MSDHENQSTVDSGSRKISAAEAIRSKLAQKKQQQADERANPSLKAGNQATMKSQMTKKVNNQRRRTGGS